jgi:hypothetical protein
MTDSIWQQIISKVDTRFKTILITNGYKTDIGEHVFWWKSAPLQLADLPAMNCKDIPQARELGCGVYDETLNIEIEAATTGATTPEDMRKIAADFDKAIDVDESWDGLAMATELKVETLALEQNENKVGQVKVVVSIEYRTVRNDPYTLG